MLRKFLFIIFSLLIVALGQPARSILLSIISATCGWAFFLYAIDGSSKKQRIITAFFWSFFVSLIQLSWMTATQYHGFYILIVWVAISILLSLQCVFFVYFLPRGSRLSYSNIFFFSGIWTLFEWSRLLLLCGFAFNPIGMALAATIYSVQMASLLGVFGLSYAVILSNLALLKAVFQNKIRYYVFWTLIALSPYAYGYLRLDFHKLHRDEKSIKNLQIALIQTGYTPEQKASFSHNLWIDIFKQLSELDAKSLDLIVFPESAVPYGAFEPLYSFPEVIWMFNKGGVKIDRASLPEIKVPYGVQDSEGNWNLSNAYLALCLASVFNTEIIIGLDDRDKEPDHYFNAAFHFSPNSLSYTRYAKKILVPLAEYLPFKWLQGLVEKYGITAFFSKGYEKGIFHGKVDYGLSICYEECFGHKTKRVFNKNNGVLVNLTNDVWFPQSTLAKQHFWHGYLRSIENGVPLIRCCNTGYTALVDEMGRLLYGIGSLRGNFETIRGIFLAKLPVHNVNTLYQHYGDWTILLWCFGFSIFSILNISFRRNLIIKKMIF